MNTSVCIRHFKYLVFSAAVISSLTGCHIPSEKNIQPEIDSIAARWVPDHRLGICDVKLKSDGGGALILSGETTNSRAKSEIIKTLNNRGIIFIDSILILPDTVRNKKFTGLVTNSVINLRKRPDDRAELVSQAILGTPVEILKNENSWLLVQTPDRYISWTDASSVEPMTRAEMDAWRHSDRLISIVNSGWIYASLDESGIVGDLVAGCIMKKAGESGGYTKVILPDGRTGFVNSRSVTDFKKWQTTTICSEDNVIRTASTFTGLPYLWVGTSSKAVDCSGFVQTVYYLNGIILLRDASLQALQGLTVDISEGYGQLRRGDLLFFGSGENSKLRVTHVAIYKGEGEYIHSSGRVKVNSLDSIKVNFSRSRVNSLLTAKRIMSPENNLEVIHVTDHPWF